MAERKSGQVFGGEQKGKFRRALGDALPDWQVFVRRPDGTAGQFTVRRGHQVALLAGAAVIALWAGIATAVLVGQPDRLAERERELDEMMAATRAEAGLGQLQRRRACLRPDSAPRADPDGRR